MKMVGGAAAYFATTSNRGSRGSSPSRLPGEHPGLEQMVKGMPFHAHVREGIGPGLFLDLIESYDLDRVICVAVDYEGHNWFGEDRDAMRRIEDAREQKIPCDIKLKGMYDHRGEFKFSGIAVNGETFGPAYRTIDDVETRNE